MFVFFGAIELLLMVVVAGGLALLLYVIFQKTRPGGVNGLLGTETQCPRCRHTNPTHANYCAHCGRRLT